jgi:nucleotide-binding universal stress UspA family protein
MNNTILVPLDGSRLAERALPRAIQLPRMTAGHGSWAAWLPAS